MWIPKKRLKTLEKRIADLEKKIQDQQIHNGIIIEALINQGLDYRSLYERAS